MSEVRDRARRAGRLLGRAAATCALCGGLLAGAPAMRAFAEEPEGDNAVNTQQLPDSSFIYDTSITDLGTADTYYDNQTVQVTGEVVGDKISEGLSGRRCWITLTSPNDSSTVTVLMSSESAAKIDAFGAYGTKGTTLQVQGTFHLACPEHEGLSDLHAEVVTAVEPGKVTEDPLDLGMFAPGAAVVALGLAMMGVFYWLRERQR